MFKFLSCLLGHRVKEVMVDRTEFNQYSPKGGTKVREIHYVCADCGKDLTEGIKMQMFYEQENRAIEAYAMSQYLKTKVVS